MTIRELRRLLMPLGGGLIVLAIGLGVGVLTTLGPAAPIVVPTLIILPPAAPAAVLPQADASGAAVAVTETDLTAAPIRVPTAAALPAPTEPPAPAASPTARPTALATPSTFTWAATPESQGVAQPVPNQIAIAFAPASTEAERAAYIESIGGTVAQILPALDTVIVSVPEAVSAAQLPPAPVAPYS